MTHTHTSGCGGGGSGTHPDTDPCGSSTERARYFPGQLITPKDLFAEQEYFLAAPAGTTVYCTAGE